MLLLCDCRPANVLLFDSGRGYSVAKLTDFGVSKLVLEGASTSHTTRVFTPGYVAPEVLWPSVGTAGSSVDVFSFGVMMGSVLTGVGPTAPDTNRHTPDTAPDRHSAAALGSSGASATVLDLHRECVFRRSDSRPSFEEVVSRLTHAVMEETTSGAIAGAGAGAGADAGSSSSSASLTLPAASPPALPSSH